MASNTSTSAEPIRVLVADNTRMNTQLLADALSRRESLDVSLAAPEARDILTAVVSGKPHVVLLSSHLQNSLEQGFDVTRIIRASASDVRVVILLDVSEPTVVIEAFRSGARGVFCRSESLEALIRCIQSVYMGQVWANSSQLRVLIEAFSETAPVLMRDNGGIVTLSKRERDVVRCVAEGLTNRKIAEHLKLTEHTVKNYLFRIFDKLGVSSRVELVLCISELNNRSRNVAITREGHAVD